MKLFKLLPLTFVLIGLLLLGIGVYLFMSTRTFIEQSVVTNGSVIAIASEWSDEGSRTYYPIIAFTTETGERVEFRSNLGSSAQLYTVDETVSVRYDPTDSASAQLNSFMALWFSTLLFLVLGLSFVVIGTFVYYLMGRQPATVQVAEKLKTNGFTLTAKSEPSA